MPFTDKVFSKNAKRTWDSFFGHLKYGFLWAFFIDFKFCKSPKVLIFAWVSIQIMKASDI